MSTHTYVTLELSQAAYDEIKSKLEAAGYSHAIHEDDVIDMHGLAVTPRTESVQRLMPPELKRRRG